MKNSAVETAVTTISALGLLIVPLIVKLWPLTATPFVGHCGVNTHVAIQIRGVSTIVLNPTASGK